MLSLSLTLFLPSSPLLSPSSRHACSQLALSGSSEESLSALLISVRREVMAALEELRAITTHDDNLERQYKEGLLHNILSTSECPAPSHVTPPPPTNPPFFCFSLVYNDLIL